MKPHFEILRATRNNILKVIESLNIEELNLIPKGFNNNIAWNFGHIFLVQHLLIYGLSELDHNIPIEIVHLFKKGAAPDIKIDEDTIDYFKSNFLKSVDILEQDYSNGIFNTYSTYPTSYGYKLSKVEDAIIFNNIHEGLHLGYIMALKRVVL